MFPRTSTAGWEPSLSRRTSSMASLWLTLRTTKVPHDVNSSGWRSVKRVRLLPSVCIIQSAES